MGRGRQEADLPARRRAIFRETYIVDSDRAQGRRNQAGEQLQQRSLAGAVGTEQGHKASGGQIEVAISKRPEKTIRFGKVFHGQAQGRNSLSLRGHGVGSEVYRL